MSAVTPSADAPEGDVRAAVPCWPCYRDGFDAPNPDEPATDD